MYATRTTAATGVGALALAALTLVPAAPATADTPTCRGEVATILGVPGQNLEGTEGRDVIVSNGVGYVNALGGDDLICLTGPTPPHTSAMVVKVVAGAGDDVVEVSSPGLSAEDVDLGPGADQFFGGEGRDTVTLGQFPGESDTVSMGGGDDSVTWSHPGLHGDTVDLGPGNDHLYLSAGVVLSPSASVVAGEGVDGASVTAGTGGAHSFNATTGTLTDNGSVTARIGSLESLSFVAEAAGTSLAWTGSEGDDSLDVSGRHPVRVDARAGAGDDFVDVINGPAAGSSFDGGPGRDQIGLGDPATKPRKTSYVLDLEKGKLSYSSASSTMRLRGFEDAYVAANKVEIHGTDGPNVLYAVAQTSVLEGRKGADTLTHGSDHRWDMFKRAKPERSTQRGGPGKDTLTGSHGRDLLIGAAGNDTIAGRNGNDRINGGPGRDKADGGAGKDTCRAVEKKKRCEL